MSINTEFLPFYLNSGQHLVIPTMLVTRGNLKSSNEAVKEALVPMKMALADAQTNLQKAQERMKPVVDRRRQS